MAEWTPDLDVDPDLARALIAEQFPGLAGAPVEPLGAGWDNAVVAVGDPPEWAFRFPRRAIAVPGVEREIAVLPQLAPRLPVAIPTPRWVGRPSPDLDYPWPFFGSPLIEGHEPADAAPSEADRAAIGAQLGRVLHALHDPALVDRLGDGLPADPNRRADMPHWSGIARRWLDRLEEASLWMAPPSVQVILDEATALPAVAPTVIAHGDLHVRHLLVTDGGRLAGVIDWGDACRGDPSIDLSLHWSFLPPPARPAFLEGYGPVSEAALLRARVLALGLSAALAAYAAREGNPALLQESLTGLDRSLAD
jgi:aminoglycoside phosphotransferase (APT) family kinase protein